MRFGFFTASARAALLALLLGGSVSLLDSRIKVRTEPRFSIAEGNEADLAVAPTVTYTSFGPTVAHNQTIVGQVISYPTIVAGENEVQWVVRLLDAKGDSVSNARLLVEAYMPEDRERVMPRPVARSLGGGRYAIDRLRFSRSGWWNVALSVQQATGTDSLAFNLIIPERPVTSANDARSLTIRSR